MAALRRLVRALAGGSGAGRLTAGRRQVSGKATRALVVAAAGAGVCAGAAYLCCAASGGRSALTGRAEARLAQLALPAVSASDKVTE